MTTQTKRWINMPFNFLCLYPLSFATKLRFEYWSKVVYRIVRILRSKSRENRLLRRCLVGKDEQSIDSRCGGNGNNMCFSFLAPKYCREVFETNKDFQKIFWNYEFLNDIWKKMKHLKTNKQTNIRNFVRYFLNLSFQDAFDAILYCVH